MGPGVRRDDDWRVLRPSVARISQRRCASPQPPADLGREALVKLGLVGLFRRLPHPLVEAMGVVADQDAPAFGLDAVENDFCRGGSGGRRLVAKTAGASE